MKSDCKNRTTQWIDNRIKENEISLKHKIQRKEGQWNKDEKSILIDSLFRGYPVNPVYAVLENNRKFIIDGVQRLSTIRDYLNDEFALSKKLEPFIYYVNTEDGTEEVEYILAGKKFSKLDKRLQENLLACELQMYELSDYTEKDIRELFRRQNSGKPLNPVQKMTAVMSDDLMDAIEVITSHPFF